MSVNEQQVAIGILDFGKVEIHVIATPRLVEQMMAFIAHCQ